MDLFKGSLRGDVRAAASLAPPEFLGSLKSVKARFDASATFLAAATPSGIVVWNHCTRDVVWSVGADERVQVTAVALSPVAPCLAYATPEPATVHLVDLDDPIASSVLAPRTTAPVCSFCFAHDGKVLVAGTGDPDRRVRTVGGEIVVIDVPQRQVNRAIDVRITYDKCLPQFAPHDIGITSVALHRGWPEENDAPPCVMATMNRKPWETSTWYVDGTWTGTGSYTSRALPIAGRFSSDGFSLAMGDTDGWVYVRPAAPFDAYPDEARMWVVGRSAQPVELLKFLPDCNHLVANELLLSVRDITGWQALPSWGQQSGTGQQPPDVRR